ncbi:MAG: ClbS/DfsB family four-helix bundle protein, partial [Candidatus Hodarchaeota archaeon]
MKQKITKKELIEQLRTERARLETLLEGLRTDQMEIPGVRGEWSVKDIIAHITVWERRGIEWIRAVAQGNEPQVPEPGYTYRDQEALNLQTYQESRKRPLSDVLEDFQ